MTQNMIGHYAVRSPGADGFLKIGKARDIQKRLGQYRTFDPHVELYASWLGPDGKEEKDIRKQFEVEWREGETYNTSRRLLAFLVDRDPSAGNHKPVKRDTAKAFLRRVTVESPNPLARRCAERDLCTWDELCAATPQHTAKGGWSLVEFIGGVRGLWVPGPLLFGEPARATVSHAGRRFVFNVYEECAERYVPVGHVVPRGAIRTGLMYGKHLKPTKANRDRFAANKSLDVCTVSGET